MTTVLVSFENFFQKTALKVAEVSDVLGSVRANSGLAACAAQLGRREEARESLRRAMNAAKVCVLLLLFSLLKLGVSLRK